MFVYDETKEFSPMRECIGKTIESTGNSSCGFCLTFTDGTVLEVNQKRADDTTVNVFMIHRDERN